MPEREILIKLLRQADEDVANKVITDYEEAIAANADYLLANGVIVPPCKVGDILYGISGYRYVVNLIMFDGGTLYYKCNIENTNENTTFTEYNIGRGIFLTKEAALKARENNG